MVEVPRLAQRDALDVGEDRRRGPDLEVWNYSLAAEVARACCRQEPGEFSHDLDSDTAQQR